MSVARGLKNFLKLANRPEEDAAVAAEDIVAGAVVAAER